MTRYLIRRSVFGLITLWVIVTAVFILYYVAPHDPARTLAGRAVTPALLDNIRHSLGLDKPILTQYWNFLGRVVRLDFGTSFINRLPVTTIMLRALPVDISLAIGAAIIWMASGVSIGVLAARRPRSIWDRAATVFVLTGLSMPTFIIGLLLLYVLFYILTIHGIAFFPPAGTYTGITQNPLEWARDLILPWITLALITAAVYSRLTRSSLLETLGEDYIRTARAKGLSERRVVLRHGVRAAINPIMTILALDIATLIGSAVLVEVVFNIPGIGRLTYTALTHSDFPIVQGTVLLGALFIVVANILADIAYAYLDPRVRYS